MEGKKGNLDRLEELSEQMCAMTTSSFFADGTLSEDVKSLIAEKEAKIKRCKKPETKLRHYESLVVSIIAMIDNIPELG